MTPLAPALSMRFCATAHELGGVRRRRSATASRRDLHARLQLGADALVADAALLVLPVALLLRLDVGHCGMPPSFSRTGAGYRARRQRSDRRERSRSRPGMMGRTEAPVPSCSTAIPATTTSWRSSRPPTYAELVGITTVAGNAALVHTTRNALVTVELAGIDVPVHSGAAGPLVGRRRATRRTCTATTGLDGVERARAARATLDGRRRARLHRRDGARRRPGSGSSRSARSRTSRVALQRAPELGDASSRGSRSWAAARSATRRPPPSSTSGPIPKRPTSCSAAARACACAASTSRTRCAPTASSSRRWSRSAHRSATSSPALLVALRDSASSSSPARTSPRCTTRARCSR